MNHIDSIHVRVPTLNEWNLLKELRLDSLRLEGKSFSSSYEVDVLKPDTYWIEFTNKIQSNDANVKVFVAVKSEDFIGMTGCYLHENGIWGIFGVYVKMEYRGMGIASQMLEKAIQHAKNQHPSTLIELYVNIQQTVALELYKKHGFSITELLQNQEMGNGDVYDEYKMIRG